MRGCGTSVPSSSRMRTVLPETHYARVGDAHIAYQVIGQGPLDLLELSNGTNISIDETNEEPHWERYVHRLASFSRLIRFDMRGIGLSDPLSPSEAPTLESTVDSALAVLDAAGTARVAVLGPGFGGAVAVLLAATHPDRVQAVVLVNSTAKWLRDDEYPYGFRAEDISEWAAGVQDTTGNVEVPEELNDAVLYAPSLASDQEFRQWWSRASRRGAGPTAARALSELYNRIDVRSALGSVGAPTLVVHRREQLLLPFGHAQYLADHLPNGTLVSLPGSDTLPYSGDINELIEPIEEFLTGERPLSMPERVLVTVMFSDIVGSTEQLADLGDRRWRDLLARHDAMV
jgi:pimeloyl-ACP methyl ester carboxylesterase